MPFCEKCGNQLKEESVFCSRCGTKKNSGSSFPDASAPSMGMRHEYSTSEFTFRIVILLISVAVDIAAIWYISEKIDELEPYLFKSYIQSSVSGLTIKDCLEILKFLRIFLIISTVIYSVEYILKILQIVNNHLCIYNDCISGKCCPFWGFGVKSFSLNYDNIYDITVKRNMMKILDVYGKKYYCFIEEPIAAKKHIKRILKQKELIQ